jgi:hypothetical protein
MNVIGLGGGQMRKTCKKKRDQIQVLEDTCI